MNTTQSPKCKILIQLHLNYKKSFPSPYSPKTPLTNLLISKFSNSLILFSVILPPSAYGLRPSASSSFFRLETLFLPFFVSLYYIMSQLLIYPSYNNRPRFV